VVEKEKLWHWFGHALNASLDAVYFSLFKVRIAWFR